MLVQFLFAFKVLLKQNCLHLVCDDADKFRCSIFLSCSSHGYYSVSHYVLRNVV